MFRYIYNGAIFMMALLLSVFVLCSSVYAVDIPQLKYHVNDYVNALSESDRLKLDKRLSDFEKNTAGHPQVVIVIMPSLGGTDIKDFATDTFAKNKLGQRENKNGLLTVWSVGDRKTKIEVGYDLNADILPTTANDILVAMRPDLRSGNYYKALDDETTALLPLVAKGSTTRQDGINPPSTTSSSTETTSTVVKPNHTSGFPFMSLIAMLLLGAAIYFIIKKFVLEPNKKTDISMDDVPPVDTYSSSDTFVRRPRPPSDLPRHSTYRPYNPPQGYYEPPIPPVPPAPPIPPVPPAQSDSKWGSAVAGGLAGFAASELLNSGNNNRDDSSNNDNSYSSRNDNSRRDPDPDPTPNPFSGVDDSGSYGSGGDGSDDSY